MKKKSSVLVLCGIIIISVILCLLLDGLKKSPNLGNIDSLTILQENSNLEISSKEDVSKFISMASSLRQVRKLESYNIGGFYILTYKEDGNTKPIFISDKYLIKDDILFSGRKCKALYNFIESYTDNNLSPGSYFSTFNFTLSSMDTMGYKSMDAPRDLLTAISKGSLDPELDKKYAKKTDIISTIYTMQDFPAYVLNGKGKEDDSISLYIINENLVYADDLYGKGRFIRVQDDLYDIIKSSMALDQPTTSSIYDLFDASKVVFKGKELSERDGAIRGLCGLYLTDEDYSKKYSLPLSVDITLHGGEITVLVYEDHIEFDGKIVKVNNAANSFLYFMKRSE